MLVTFIVEGSGALSLLDAFSFFVVEYFLVEEGLSCYLLEFAIKFLHIVGFSSCFMVILV